MFGHDEADQLQKRPEKEDAGSLEQAFVTILPVVSVGVEQLIVVVCGLQDAVAGLSHGDDERLSFSSRLSV